MARGPLRGDDRGGAVHPGRGAWLPSRTFLLILLLLSVSTNALFAVRLHSPRLWERIRGFARPAVPGIRPGESVLGDPETGIPVVVYSDFQCPFSARLHESLRALAGEVELAVVFRHLPLRRHPMAARAAEAAECAADQGLFWEYADLLFALQGDLSEEVLREVAAGLGMDAEAFGTCLDAGTHHGAVAAQAAEASRLGITGTPTFFIRGRRYDAALPYTTLKRELLDAGGRVVDGRCE